MDQPVHSQFHPVYFRLPSFSWWGILVVWSLCLLLTFPSYVISQQTPSNIGFETGTFTGWTGATGQCCPVYTPQTGIDTNRHVITSGNYTDPYSSGLVTVVAPGSLFSSRLGNNSGSAESEILDYSFTVPSDSMLLVIRFAVILENANHPPIKQPRFGYEITSSSSQLLGCLSEQVVAGDGTYDFVVNGPIEILDWQTRVIDLTGMVGETINIHFETGDCEPGGHFGYAYVDGELSDSKITASLCNADGSITLYAPGGINGTWFNGTTADSVTISNPLQGSTYTLELLPNSGCNITLVKTLDGDYPESNFDAVIACDYSAGFQNLSSCDPGSVYIWNFGDGQSGNVLQPVHQYSSPGTYEVILQIQQPDNCRAEYSEIITIDELPQSGFETTGHCLHQPVMLNSNSSGQENSYSWIIDGEALYTNPAPEHIFSQPGLHTVSLIVINANQCSDTTSASLDISDEPGCIPGTPSVYLPNAFTPNGDGINDNFEANKVQTGEEPVIDIYNRFGELIFTGRKWDGRFNGSICPQGAYGFRLMYFTGNTRQYKTGTVMLLR